MGRLSHNSQGTHSAGHRIQVRSGARRLERYPFIPRVVLKLHDSIDLPYEVGEEAYFEQCQIGSWCALSRQFPGIVMARLFPSVRPKEMRRLVDRAVKLDPIYQPPNFLTYFAVQFPPGTDPVALAETLARWPSVQFAYPEGRLGPPPADGWNGHPTHDGRRCPPSPGYLDPAPAGLDVRFAQEKMEGRWLGEPIRFVDIEQGWTLNHRDLAQAGITLSSGLNRTHFAHGTSVLGIVVATGEHSWNMGMTPHVQGRVVSEWRPDGKYNRADAIMAAAATMRSGDVLLIQTQFWPADGGAPLPAEVRPAVFDSIRLCSALGIVVVEPSGNGWHDLDTLTDQSGRQPLNRSNAGFQDSGAIMVGAARSGLPHARLEASSFGSRVDCYAWGENVETLTSDSTGTATDQYTRSFGGTSSSAAILAGAALIVQNVAEVRLGSRLRPDRVRALLSSPSTGTASSHPAEDRIGVMPDLRKILATGFGIA